jgi:hypothetical protein
MTPFQAFDALLIAPFRLTASPEFGFILGVATLALASALLGRACKALVSLAQRSRRSHLDAETQRRQDLSVQAAQSGDKRAYMAQNHLAQEAYGDSLALAAGRAAALLWPGMAVLGWLAWRFEGAPMPLLWESAGPASWFLPLYVLAIWGSGRLLRAGKI